MLRNNLKIAWRNLWKHKGYSALNIFGLAIGITCAAFILLWVEDEIRFDAVFPDQDLIYMVPTNQIFDGAVYTFYSTPGPLANDLKEDIPEINKASTTWGTEILLSDGNNGINRYGRYVQPDFLDIFSLEFLEGDAKTALSRPDGIVLTQKTATALFGDHKNLLNHTITINNAYRFTITGILKDLPTNISFGFNWLLPFERFQLGEDDMSWAEEYGNNFADTFVAITPRSDFKKVDDKVRTFIGRKTNNSDDPDVAFLHSIKDWHLRSDFKDGKIVGGRIGLVKSLLFIALIILLIACINFMNLSTARSSKRANEVGIRKVLGSSKKRLTRQFMLEALLLASVASLCSLIFLVALLPGFNSLVGKQIELHLFDLTHLSALIGMTLVCGLLAGWYPAFYLSSFLPVNVLKGKANPSAGSSLIRKGLVITQFAVSIIFIISSAIIYQQIGYLKARDVGYAKDALVNLPVSGTMIDNFNPIKKEMIGSGLIKDVALTNSNMLSSGNNGSGLRWQGGMDTEDVLIRFRYVSPSFFNTVDLDFLEGHGFHENRAVDSTNVIITHSFAELLGVGSALGKTIRRNDTDFNVIGVVKDYLYGDLYGNGKTGPVMFFNHYDYGTTMYIHLKPEAPRKKALSTISQVLKKYNPAFPFEYRFENELFNARFKNEQLVGELAKIFAVLAILISCLGLFGLAAFTAEQRRKEIGVRKVLGSTIGSIARLLSFDFIRLVFWSLLIATPLAWWAMRQWLNGFPYRVAMDWRIFLMAGAIAMGIALITVSFLAIRAAIANPIKSLRTE